MAHAAYGTWHILCVMDNIPETPETSETPEPQTIAIALKDLMSEYEKARADFNIYGYGLLDLGAERNRLLTRIGNLDAEIERATNLKNDAYSKYESICHAINVALIRVLEASQGGVDGV